MTFKKTMFSIVMVSAVLFSVAAITSPQVPEAHAQTSSDANEGVSLTNPLGTSDVRVLIGRIIQAALGVVGSIALAMFIWGGFLWLTSGGNTERIERGKKVFMWSTLGLIAIFGAYAIVNTVVENVTTGGQATEEGGEAPEPEE